VHLLICDISDLGHASATGKTISRSALIRAMTKALTPLYY
jgi:hypothetical protein